MKKLVALHVLEKGEKVMNLKCVDASEGVWETGNWWVSKAVAEQMIGKRIYIHSGQKLPSHQGGEVLSVQMSPASAEKRTKRFVFTFRALPECQGVTTDGWGNEKKYTYE